MKYADLHCDTLLELYRGGYSITDAPTHVSLNRVSAYSPYIQLCAIWSDRALSDDDAYTKFFEVTDSFEKAKPDKIALCRSFTDIETAIECDRAAFVYAVEDARLLNYDITRLHSLYERGVRFLTFAWSGFTCIGGAFETDFGLSDFGREVLCECFSLGIIPDVSHASPAMTDEIISMCATAGKPVLATHSNSYALCPHRRNLTDERFCLIRDSGGAVGVSLCTQHLTSSTVCTIDDAVSHILHYLELGGGDTVCFGCDFDGIEATPDGISDVSELYKIADKLSIAGVTDDQIDKLYFNNAYRFLSENLR